MKPVVLLALLLGAFPALAQLRLSEFMAANTRTLADEDGDYPDWIELENTGATSLDLAGWHLTDNPGLPAKWTFPATNLPGGARLVVFASGKNRTNAGAVLHTNFRLSADGGFVGLISPDGVTMVDAFRDYPPQAPDRSYGRGLAPSRVPETLAGPGQPLRFLLPTNTIAAAWNAPGGFDDSGWSNGTFSLGFDVTTNPAVAAYSVPANTPGNQNYSGGLGMDFDALQPVTVTELGCFDPGSDGLSTTITVQLWRRNNGGTPADPVDDTGAALLTNLTFTAAVPGTLRGGSRFKPLVPALNLSPGSYTIVASGYGATDLNGNGGAAGFGQSLNAGGGALQFVGRSRFGPPPAFPGSPDVHVAQYGAGTFTYRAANNAAFGTLVAAMRGRTPTALTRLAFVPPAADWQTLLLNITYDDGFIAHLNGVEVARRNAPASPAFDSTATATGAATESLDLGPFLPLLAPGATNLLAVQGFNTTADDADFRLSAAVVAERGATNRVFFATATPGTANAPGTTAPGPVIHEIHTDPPNSKATPAEFIELYNPLTTPVDLSGWSFSRGVTFTFPPGTTLAPRGYVVIAGDPSTVARQFGVSALGPWTGSLNNDGETLELLDAAGAAVDAVTYGLGFPWPTVGEGTGLSLQLVNEGLDNDLGGSWRSGPPTPGQGNSVTLGNAPPQLRQVQHLPASPRSGDPVTVSIRASDPDGIAGVTLEYQIVTPGNYLRLADAAFTNQWTTLPMHDDGLAGDPQAGDGVFTVVVPGGVQSHRRLIRYRVVASDLPGAQVRVPYADDPARNFAWFVYDGIPAWSGAVQPGVTPVQTFGTNTLGRVQAFHLLSRSNDVWNCQYNAAFNDGTYRFEGAVVIDGRVYDHVFYRPKGQNSTYNTGKNKWKFKFNRGHWLKLPDDYGREHTVISTLNISSLSAPWAPWNRGLAGLDEALQYRLSNLAGVPAPRTTYIQLRVIDDPVEAPANTQFDGDLWGLYLAFENQDNRFKEAHGLPDGNIFRLQVTHSASHLLGQGAGQPGDLSDLNTFLGANGYNRTPPQPEGWWRTNVDLPRYFSWRAVNEAVNNTDIRDQENVVYFRDPTDGRWHIQPWDCDLLYEQFDRWGPEATQATSPYEQIRRCLTVPAITNEFRNHVRHLQDLLLNADQAGRLIDEYVALITDGSPAQPGFVEVDRRRWDYRPENPVPPRGAGNVGNYYKTPYPVPNMGLGPNNYSRVLASPDFAGFVKWTRDFIVSDDHGGGRLARMADDPTIPATPGLAYAGAEGFPADGLALVTSPFASPAGRTFAAMNCRLAEVYHPGVPGYLPGTPNRYEIDATWTSGDLTTFTNRIVVPSAYVAGGRTYRVRVRHLDSAGRWSHWSAPVEFTAGPPAVPPLARDLAVTEIMYRPASDGILDGDEFEFLELKNIGGSSLDLSGLVFGGINFTFTNGTRLAPGAFFLLGRNPGALAGRYPGIRVDGTYAGRLDNGGETLTLSQPVSGRVVWSFTYDDDVPWPLAADGLGFSLVAAPGGAPNSGNPADWRPSAAAGGSPGSDDPPASAPGIVIQELLARPPGSGFVELFNPADVATAIGGWFLTDDPAVPGRFVIPAGTVIPAGGRIVLPASTLAAGPPGSPGPVLQPLGGGLYLFAADGTNITGYSHGVRYGASAVNTSFGRHVNSAGDTDFPAQLEPTPGAPDAGPRVGPVVISEIMFHPPDVAGVDNERDEFIELANVSAEPVDLGSAGTGSWRLRNAVDFDFAPGTQLPPGGRLLVVGFDPATNGPALAGFRDAYPQSAATPIAGPWRGKLDNSGERLELERPEVIAGLGTGFVPVDAVAYRDGTPWPAGADGIGNSLQRLVDTAHGNEPTNWFAAGLTPGSASVPDRAPGVVLVSPAGGTTVQRPVDLLLRAAATDPDDTVARVEFLAGTNLVGQSTGPVFAATWMNAPTGTHRLTARAFDQFGAIAVSTPVTVTVLSQSPLITWLGPTNDALVRMGTPLPLTVSAVDPDGSITRVDFLLNDLPLGSVSNAPFAGSWAARPGFHVLTAVALDNSGLAATSAPVRVQVQATLGGRVIVVPTNSNWSYLDDGSNQGTAWSQPGFNDSGWSNGPAQLGFGDNDERTVLRWGTNTSNRHITYYFRRQFVVPSLVGASNAILRVLRDDGAIAYLNGVEVFRSNMTNGTVTHTNRALAAAGGTDESTYFPTNVSLARLVPGTNLLAVEVHQNAPNSPDLSFAAEFGIETHLLGPAILAAPRDQTITAGGTAVFEVTATGTEPLTYQWFFNGQPVAGAHTPQLTLAGLGTTNSGSYAVLISNPLTNVLSLPASLVVTTPDSDQDGLPDDWELAHGLNPLVNDAGLDPDGDGLTNLQEYLACTDPQSAVSVLQLTGVSLAGGELQLSFVARAGCSYDLQTRTDASAGTWLKVATFPAAPGTQTRIVTNHIHAAAQFFRVVTPSQP